MYRRETPSSGCSGLLIRKGGDGWPESIMGDVGDAPAGSGARVWPNAKQFQNLGGEIACRERDT